MASKGSIPTFNKEYFSNILSNYFEQFQLISVEKLSHGNVNDTFKIELINITSIDTYILQRINTKIFQNPHIIKKNHYIYINRFSKEKSLNYSKNYSIDFIIPLIISTVNNQEL